MFSRTKGSMSRLATDLLTSTRLDLLHQNLFHSFMSTTETVEEGSRRLAILYAEVIQLIEIFCVLNYCKIKVLKDL